MQTIINATVVAVKIEPNRLNFNFRADSINEAWCLGRLDFDPLLPLKVGDNVVMFGGWNLDQRTQSRPVSFLADRVLKLVA